MTCVLRREVEVTQKKHRRTLAGDTETHIIRHIFQGILKISTDFNMFFYQMNSIQLDFSVTVFEVFVHAAVSTER